MAELDVRGLSCPEPMLNLKPLLERGESAIKVLCSCGASSDNIRRLATQYGYIVESQTKNGEDLEFILKK
ncbi:sulfurtransferase TusA family protein [Helicobacter turcicus]|uniref:Sulfurtransferase TusA family protein n=1 Tax=Helicobacter turcicus TaxID=2867412 RepID=A0ABS7JPU0_9HELI|nr:sulfurtransferase TusA family protein [Helicobacter turcicus]MBX7491372.1 sulfurtransferase TusA family protein [Helicobacter turcicus]MBX7546239.1 sulfurtransferase TusA family protein [Helicobacter turcicus]